MNKEDFLNFYSRVIQKLGKSFEEKHSQFKFNDIPDTIFEEYMCQKTMLRWIYGKKDGQNEKTLLDRHKVCACMVVAIIKVRPITLVISSDDDFQTKISPRVNEQLAFMSSWELLKAFVLLNRKELDINYILPTTYHNVSFLDTITRSLFFANQLNGLSTPLLANIFFLIEKYCENTSQKAK